MTYINNQKPIINDNVENEDNNGINDDLKGIIIGVFTMLSGTYGLVFRGIVSWLTPHNVGSMILNMYIK